MWCAARYILSASVTLIKNSFLTSRHCHRLLARTDWPPPKKKINRILNSNRACNRENENRALSLECPERSWLPPIHSCRSCYRRVCRAPSLCANVMWAIDAHVFHSDHPFADQTNKRKTHRRAQRLKRQTRRIFLESIPSRRSVFICGSV